MYYGKSVIEGTEQSCRYDGKYTATCKFLENKKVQKFMEPRIQAIVNSFQKSSFFAELELPEGFITGGEVSGIFVDGANIEKPFFCPERICALYKTEGQGDQEIKIWLDSMYNPGFCRDSLRLFENPEYWYARDMEEVEEINRAEREFCPFWRFTFEKEVPFKGIKWHNDSMLNREEF